MAIKREEPGLLMRYAGITTPPPVPLPPGYEVRSWRDGDDAAWVRLMQVSGAFGDWDATRLAKETRGVLHETQFFAVHDGALVAATGVIARPLAGEPALELAWVARDPAHRGHRLGLAVIVEALRTSLALPGSRDVFLYTDAHRLTAIGIYLDLGFAPDLTSHPAYARRWELVFRRRAERGTRGESVSAELAASGGGHGPAARTSD